MSIRCGYCGPGTNLPPGYDYFENRNICLRKGFGSGASVERRKWQRRLGIPIDPPYVSPCPKKDRGLIRQVRRNNRRDRNNRQRIIVRRDVSPNRSRNRSRSRTPVIRSRSRTPVRRSRSRSRSRTPIMRGRSRTPIMRRRRSRSRTPVIIHE